MAVFLHDAELAHEGHQRVSHADADGVVERGGSFDAGHGHVGPTHQGLGNGEALGTVGVEQRRAGPAARREHQLPGQVEGVLHAGVHPLASHRAVDVAGVSGDEHPPVLVPIDVAVVNAKRHHPRGVAGLRAGQAGVQGALEQLQRRFGDLGLRTSDDHHAVAPILEEGKQGHHRPFAQDDDDLVIDTHQRQLEVQV